MPPRVSANDDALRIWPIVARQVIVGGMGTVVDINHLAVWAAIDRYGVVNPVKTFEQILMIFEHFRKEDGDGD